MNPAHKERIEKDFEKLMAMPGMEFFAEKVRLLKQISVEDKEFIVDQFRWSEIRLNKPEAWLSELITICYKITLDTPVLPEIGMFFIRLHGVLSEMPQYFSERSKLFAILESENPDFKKSCLLSEEIHSQLMQLKDSFEKIELLAIEFMRNQNAHVGVNSYRVQQNANGTTSRNFQKEDISRMEQMDEIVRHLYRYNVEELPFAKAIIPRVLPALIKIKGLMEERSKLNAVVV